MRVPRASPSACRTSREVPLLSLSGQAEKNALQIFSRSLIALSFLSLLIEYRTFP